MLNENLYGGSSKIPFRKGKVRFLFLLLVVLVAFGNQYAFNNPQALEETIYEHLKISETEFQLFYSLYSLPNVFTLLFLGYFLDKFGMRIGLLLLSFGILTFQLLFAIGGYLESYSIMLIGRILFGIVSRGLFIPQASLISFWFKGRELSFALGVGITFPQLGNALNSLITPLIYDKTDSLSAPLFFSVGVCLLSFVCAVIAFRMDRQAQNADISNDAASESSDYSLETQESKHEKIKFSDLKDLNNTFWILSILCTLTMTQYIPFLDNANRLFQKRFCYTQSSAGQVITVTYIATAMFSGPLGLIVNRVGYRRFFIIGATFIFFSAHTLIWLLPQCQIQAQSTAVWGLLMIGIGFSFYANVIVASIPLVVQRKVLGSALSIMQILSSLAECIVPLIAAGMIQDSVVKEQGFKKTSFFFFLIGLLGVVVSLPLLCIDKRIKRRLDKSEKNRIEPQRLDQIQIPSQYKRIQDEPKYSFKMNMFSKKAQTSPGFQLINRQLF